MLIDDQILVFLTVFGISFLIFEKWNKKGNKTHFRSPPSLPSLPLVGSLPYLRNFNNIPAFFMQKSLELGPIFTLRAGKTNILTLNNREAIKEAYLKNSRSFSDRPEVFMDGIANPNRKGIAFMNTSAEWKRGHLISMSILKEFGYGAKNIMEEKILTELEAVCEFVRAKAGQPFVLRNLTILATSNIIMNFLFGNRRDFNLGLSELVHHVEKYVNLLDPVYDIAPFVKYIPLYSGKISRIRSCVKVMMALIEKEINQCLKNTENITFVHRYIEKEGPDYNREQLTYILRDVIGGGTDTLSITIQWLFAALADNPAVQKRLQMEIDAVVPKERLPKLADQPELPYVEAVSLEIYRLYTLIPLSVGRQTSSGCFLNGFFIPAETLVMANLYAAHRNPNEWEDPDEFRPERFLDKDNKIIGRDRVIAFSLGKRSCFGELLARIEIFLTLTTLMQRFTVLPPEGQDKVNAQPEMPISLLTRPEPFLVRFVERK